MERSRPAKFLDQAVRLSLFLLALSAPVSIAATQTAWALAVLFTLVRAAFVRPAFRPSAMDAALLAFVGLTLLSSFFSYEPEVSLRKMVAVSLVTIVYLFSSFIRDRRAAATVIVLLLAGSTASSVYSFAVLAIGKNLKVVRLAENSPLRSAGVAENDTLLRLAGRDIQAPDDLAAAIAGLPPDGRVPIRFYRHELIIDTELQLSAAVGSAGEAWFGIDEWQRGRDTRAAGFYGHYTTFAEVLQLVSSLALAMLIAAPGPLASGVRVLLAGVLAVNLAALFLTITRASWAAFLVSAAVIVAAGLGRRALVICIAAALPLAIAGAVFLQQKRQVGFVDMADGSTSWRVTVWREGAGVLAANPRHLAVGIGMDSLKRRWQDWGMFDNGRLPLGHMHSNPLQIALERGVPALIAWLAWMLMYLGMLWRTLRSAVLGWLERAILLGALGGSIGFLASGLVHYNWGDSEVVMVFYLLMGISLAVIARVNGPGHAPEPAVS